MPWGIHPAALQELHDSIRYYADIDPALAIAFQESYHYHLQAVLDNPKLYGVRHAAVRRANLIPRFKEYYIAYTIRRETVVILAIAHGKRRPHYWRSRVDAVAASNHTEAGRRS